MGWKGKAKKRKTFRHYSCMTSLTYLHLKVQEREKEVFSYRSARKTSREIREIREPVETAFAFW